VSFRLTEQARDFNRGQSRTTTAWHVSQVVEHLFRNEAERWFRRWRDFWDEHLGLAEDVVQEALARALQTWPYYGVPKNPPRGSCGVSESGARRCPPRKSLPDKEVEITALIEQRAPAYSDGVFLEQEIEDDRLRMMFACCHPRVPRKRRWRSR